MAAPIIELSDIVKRYPGVVALDHVSLDLHRHEVHGLAGENGAGKSTLIKVLSGAIQPEEGTIRLDGEPVRFHHPLAALRAGISVVHQELEGAPHLTVTENILLGQLPRFLGVVRWGQAHQRARELLGRLSVDLDVKRPLGSLSLGQQQLVEIARALARDVRVLVLDEPSAILGQQDVERLFNTVQSLRGDGVACVYISHRLDEHFTLADRISVLRDGKYVGTRPTGEIDHRVLVTMMTGREVTRARLAGRRGDSPSRTPLLQTRSLTVAGSFRDVDLELRPGEILGVAGLIGAGRTEVARAIAGIDPATSGEIWVGGRKVTIRSPRQARRLGIDLVPEDRKGQGLLLNRSVRENIGIGSLASRARFGVIDGRRDRLEVAELARRVDLRHRDEKQLVGTLSGGNQQKVLLARTLAAGSRILLFDEPTRGVDVGGKREIWQLIRGLADDGAAVMLISSEIEEIVTVSDRVMVMRGGTVAAHLEGDDITEGKISEAALLQTVGGDRND